MAEEIKMFICRICGWKGESPKIKNWSELGGYSKGSHGEDIYTPPSSGSIEKCPECDSIVNTQEGWEAQDRSEKMAVPIIVAFFSLCVIVILLNY